MGLPIRLRGLAFAPHAPREIDPEDDVEHDKERDAEEELRARHWIVWAI